MPTGIPKRGYRRTKRLRNPTLSDIEEHIQGEVPSLVAKLEQLTKPIVCPECGHVMDFIDKDVAMFLIDHGIGKPRQKLEIDITERIVLTPIQIDKLVERYQIASRLMLPSPKGMTKEGMTLPRVDKV